MIPVFLLTILTNFFMSLVVFLTTFFRSLP